MALEGFLQEFGLADILQLIYFQRKVGILHIDAKQDSIEISFVNGNIVGLKSKRRSEGGKIGKILLKKGLINRKDLDSAIEMQKTEGLKIGNIFAMHGLVSKEALLEVIQEQVVDTLVQIFTWKEGKYEFVPQEISVDKVLPISLDTQHLLMDGLRIVDEWSVVEGKLDLNTIYRKVGEPDPEELSDMEKEVLGLVDEETDVITITNISSFGDFDTSKVLISLEEKGYIEPIVFKPLTDEIAAPRSLDYPFYAVILFVVLFVLIFLLKGNFDAFKVFRDSRIGYKIEKLKTDIDIYRAVRGKYPQNLEIITKEKDPWGKQYIYKFTKGGYLLFSAGPDREEGTKDDVY